MVLEELDKMLGLEAEEEGDEEGDEEKKPKPAASKQSSQIIDKQDLILLILMLFLGLAGGYAIARVLRREDRPPIVMYPPSPQYPPPIYEKAATPIEEPLPAQHYRLEPGRKRVTKRYGYYTDEAGDAHLDVPSVQENWIIRRDAHGNILDAYKIPGTDELI